MAELYRDAAPVPLDAIYRVARTDAHPVTLMPGHDRAWKSAQRIEWGPARYRTIFRALWNDEGLAIRFDVCDDRPWHTMTRLDDPIGRRRSSKSSSTRRPRAATTPRSKSAPSTS